MEVWVARREVIAKVTAAFAGVRFAVGVSRVEVGRGASSMLFLSR